MRYNLQQRIRGSYMRGEFELSRWGKVAFTQGVQPAVDIADYSIGAVIFQWDDLCCGSR